jgi:hypothetical protein
LRKEGDLKRSVQVWTQNEDFLEDSVLTNKSNAPLRGEELWKGLPKSAANKMRSTESRKGIPNMQGRSENFSVLRFNLIIRTYHA